MEDFLDQPQAWHSDEFERKLEKLRQRERSEEHPAAEFVRQGYIVGFLHHGGLCDVSCGPLHEYFAFSNWGEMQEWLAIGYRIVAVERSAVVEGQSRPAEAETATIT